jgi:CreA protein
MLTPSLCLGTPFRERDEDLRLATDNWRTQVLTASDPQEVTMRLSLFVLATALAVGATAPALAEQVGEVGVDWLGNDILVEAIKDPKVEGVTCHVSYFDRGVIDRLQKGNWFENPSDTAISCQQTGPITIGDISLKQGGEEVFKQGISLIWKEQVVNRIYDKQNQTLIYLAHSRQVQNGSAKMSMTTVPLYNQNVTWTKGKPQ